MSLEVRRAVVMALALALALVGCSRQARPMTRAIELDDIKLREVGRSFYRLHQVMVGKVPRSLKDFNAIGAVRFRPRPTGRSGAATSSQRWDAHPARHRNPSRPRRRPTWYSRISRPSRRTAAPS